MDSVSRLTGRQRRRLLRFGIPRAVRFAVAAVLAAVFFGVLLGVSISAHAIGSVTQSGVTYVKSWVASGAGFVSSSQPSLGAACQDSAAKGTASGTARSPFSMTVLSSALTGTGGTGVCHFQKTENYCPGGACGTDVVTNFDGNATGTDVATPTCPSNSTNVGGSCYCAGGYRPPSSGPQTTCSTYTCEAKPFADRSSGPFTKNPTPPGPQAIDHFCDTNANVNNANYGCNINETMYMAKQGADGNWWGLYVSAYDTRTCQPGAQNQASPTNAGLSPDATASEPGRSITPGNATTCAANQCPVTVNGASVCVVCTRTVGSGSSSANPGDPAASGPGAGAETTVQKRIDCVGDLCTLTTVTSVAGAVTSTVTESQNKAAYCAGAPKDPSCGGGSGSGSGSGGDGNGAAFGGTCLSGFTCSGDSDAVTCAIATEQHQRDCQFALNFGIGTSTPFSDKGIAMSTSGDLGDADHPRRTANVPSAALGTFDQTNLLTGSCPGDRSIATVRGIAIVLPFSKLCGSATLLGNVLVGFAALICVFIVFGVNRS